MSPVLAGWAADFDNSDSVPATVDIVVPLHIVRSSPLVGDCNWLAARRLSKSVADRTYWAEAVLAFLAGVRPAIAAEEAGCLDIADTD